MDSRWLKIEISMFTKYEYSKKLNVINYNYNNGERNEQTKGKQRNEQEN